MTDGSAAVASPAVSDPATRLRWVALLGMLVALGPLSIDLYLPALPAIAAGLATTTEAVQTSVTVFLAGFSGGMLLYGPMSDRWGRRPVMLTGLVLFTLASAACAMAPDIHSLLAARAAQALGGGAASVLARAAVRDVFEAPDAVAVLSMMSMVTTIAPLLAPAIGSATLYLWGWRGPFVFLTLWGIGAWVVTTWRLQETLPPSRRSAASLGQAFLAYVRLLGDPASLALCLAGGLSFAAMFAYITASPFYFIELRGWTPTAYGLMFGGNAVGILLASGLNGRWVRRVGALRLATWGAVMGLSAAALLWLSMRQGVMAESPSGSAMDSMGSLGVSLGLFGVVSVVGLMGANCIGLLMERHPCSAGAAAALFVSGQFGLGMLASALVNHLHDGTGGPMASVMALASAGSFLAMMWVRRAFGAAAHAP